MEPKQVTSIEDAMRPAFEEISRRSEVARAKLPQTETTFFDRTKTPCKMPFQLPDQKYALLSMGTNVLAPRPLDVDRPALRVYGLFRDRDDAKEHAEVVRTVDAECSLLVVEARKWMLMPQSMEVCQDQNKMNERVEELLRRRDACRAGENEEFDSVLSRCEEPPISSALPDEEDPDEHEAEALIYKPPKRLRAGAEVRGQSFFAMCAIRDVHGGECLINILGGFESVEEANKWSQDVATRTLIDDDVLVAPTCEWTYPNGTQRTSKTNYRIDELQRVMDAAEKNPQAVKDYKVWKEEQDRMCQNQNGDTSTVKDITEEEE